MLYCRWMVHKISETLTLDRAVVVSLASINTSFISCPVLTPDLSRQGQIAAVFDPLHSAWTREDQGWGTVGVWSWRSRVVVLGKPNLAEQCCYWDYTTPLPGEL